MVEYVFNVGDLVKAYPRGYRLGEVIGCVPGDGITEWYYVRWEDDSEDRYTRDELTGA